MDDTKNTLTGELRRIGGSRSVSKVSPVGASAANTVTERSVRKMQSSVRTIDAYIEWVYGTPSDPLVVQFRPGLWRSWDMWSAALSQVLWM